MRGSAVQARPVAPNINKARCGFFYAFLSENKNMANTIFDISKFKYDKMWHI